MDHGAVIEPAGQQPADVVHHPPEDTGRRHNRLHRGVQKLKVHSANTLARIKRVRKRIFASFLLLGMGMATFNASISQCSDYLSLQYQNMYVPRLAGMFYTLGFLLMTIKYFFSGSDKNNKPRQRARMVHGYFATLFALLMPVVIDGVAHRLLPRDTPASQLNGLVAPWVLGAFVAGGAEGALATVVYGEAAAFKGDRAAAYGRVFVSLLMPALRCMSKSQLPADYTNTGYDNMSKMRESATAHMVVAAAILIGCLFVVLVIMPKLVAKIQKLESLDVPPALNFQATLDTAAAAEQAGIRGQEAQGAMSAVGSLAAMLPAADATYAMPLIKIRRKGKSFKFAHVDGQQAEDAAQLPSTGSQLSLMSSQPTLRHYMDEYKASMGRRQQHSLQLASTATAELNPHTLQRVDEEDKAADAEQPDSDVSQAPGTRADSFFQSQYLRMCSNRRLGTLTANNLAPGLSSGRLSGRLSARWDSIRHRHHTDAGMTVQDSEGAQHKAAGGGSATPAHSKDVRDTSESQDQQLPLHQAVFSGLALKRWQQSVFGGKKGKQLSTVDEADSKDMEDIGASPFASEQMISKLDSMDDSALEVPLHVKIQCCWEAALAVWPFLAVSFLMPVINGQLMPLAYQRDWSKVAYGKHWDGIYLTQIITFASVTGGFLGSLFVNKFKRRTQMLFMASGMLAFLPAFALSIYHEKGPAGQVVLVFCMNAYSGYLNSVAKQTINTRSKAEERWIQMVLSLVSAFSFFAGNCIGWMWIRIKL